MATFNEMVNEVKTNLQGYTLKQDRLTYLNAAINSVATTMVGVEKVKDMDTGGKHTGLNEQVLCNFNYGLGFEVYGVNPIEVIKHGF